MYFAQKYTMHFFYERALERHPKVANEKREMSIHFYRLFLIKYFQNTRINPFLVMTFGASNSYDLQEGPWTRLCWN